MSFSFRSPFRADVHSLAAPMETSFSMRWRGLGLVWPVVSLLAFISPLRAAHFLAPDQIDLRAALPAPPSRDSLTTRAELDVVAQLERDRTPAQTEFARNPPTGDVFAFAAAVLGPWFTAANLPKTAALFSRIDEDGRAITTAAKTVHPERPRPFLADARIVAPTSRPGGSSYPSGAGYNTAVWTAVLIAIFPEHAAGLQTRAEVACWSRIVAGVHYPTDNTGGRMLGEAVARKILALPDAQAALAEVRAEIARSRSRS